MNDYRTLKPDFAVIQTRAERMPSLTGLVSGYFEAYDVHVHPQGWLMYDGTWEMSDRNVPFDPITGFENEYLVVQLLLDEKLYHNIPGKRRLK